MDYIVLDLEWNQPISFESSVYKKVGDKLLFEMIQIGAVKVNEKKEIVDALSLPIKPAHYVKIHPRIQRLTQLNKDMFVRAPAFEEAMDLFVDWCGNDYALMVWGCDDTSVLQQNIDFFKWEGKIPPLYDLQHCFSDMLNLGKERKGLKYAMELLEIQEEEELGFHNALNDAYYTAQVFQRVPSPDVIFKYPTKAKKLGQSKKKTNTLKFTLPHEKRAKLFDLPKLKAPACPYCKKNTCLVCQYINAGQDHYVNLATCKEHGDLFVQVEVKQKNQDDQVVLRVSRASQRKKAYVLAKNWKGAGENDRPQKDNIPTSVGL